MNSSAPNIRNSAFYTPREAAWLLGVDASEVCRAIRTGALPVVRHRSRLVIPAHVLIRWLAEPTDTSPPTTARPDSGGGDAR